MNKIVCPLYSTKDLWCTSHIAALCHSIGLDCCKQWCLCEICMLWTKFKCFIISYSCLYWWYFKNRVDCHENTQAVWTGDVLVWMQLNFDPSKLWYSVYWKWNWALFVSKISPFSRRKLAAYVLFYHGWISVWTIQAFMVTVYSVVKRISIQGW